MLLNSKKVDRDHDLITAFYVTILHNVNYQIRYVATAVVKVINGLEVVQKETYSPNNW